MVKIYGSLESYDVPNNEHEVIRKEDLTSTINNVLQDIVEGVNIGGTFYGIKKQSIDTSSTIPANTNINVPGYRVNTETLFVYKDGKLLTKNIDYYEVGEPRNKSKYIRFYNDIAINEDIDIVVFSLESDSYVEQPEGGWDGEGGEEDWTPPTWTGGEGSPDAPIDIYYYVDITNGSGANNGLSPETALQFPNDLKAKINTLNGWYNITVYIAEGDYFNQYRTLTISSNLTTDGILLTPSRKSIKFIGYNVLTTYGIDLYLTELKKSDYTVSFENLWIYTADILNSHVTCSNMRFGKLSVKTTLSGYDATVMNWSNIKIISRATDTAHTAAPVKFEKIYLRITNFELLNVKCNNLPIILVTSSLIYFLGLFNFSNEYSTAYPAMISDEEVTALSHTNTVYFGDTNNPVEVHIGSNKINTIIQNTIYISVYFVNCEFYIDLYNTLLDMYFNINGAFMINEKNANISADNTSFYINKINNNSGYFLKYSYGSYTTALKDRIKFTNINIELSGSYYLESFFYLYSNALNSTYDQITWHVNSILISSTPRYKFTIYKRTVVIATSGGGLTTIPGTTLLNNLGNSSVDLWN